MRILLLAYEFPPIQSAQSLRWFYLANQLASRGAQLDVLTPRIHDVWQNDWSLHPQLTVHRCYPGPFVAISSYLARGMSGSPQGSASPESRRPGLSERMYRTLRRILDQLLLPDVRTEWLPFAWHQLKRLQAQKDYQLIISSHEPGVDLLLGLRAKRRENIGWLVDLADPLEAVYTPAWRKPLDRRLERRVCQAADHILVTTEQMIPYLRRHGPATAPITTLTQGYTSSQAEGSSSAPSESVLELVYTGNFYRAFRNPTELFTALAQVQGVRLTVAGAVEEYATLLDTLGDKVRLLGRINHMQCLELQRTAGVLLSLGNRQSAQIPGKLYEYFGACRPILHISQSDTDPAARLLQTLQRGQVVANQQDALIEALHRLRDQHTQGVLEAVYDLRQATVQRYSWDSLGEGLWHLCQQLVKEKRVQAG